jgi:hypothetical protein
MVNTAQELVKNYKMLHHRAVYGKNYTLAKYKSSGLLYVLINNSYTKDKTQYSKYLYISIKLAV